MKLVDIFVWIVKTALAGLLCLTLYQVFFVYEWPDAKFKRECRAAGGVPNIGRNAWVCYAPTAVIDLKGSK